MERLLRIKEGIHTGCHTCRLLHSLPNASAGVYAFFLGVDMKKWIIKKALSWIINDYACTDKEKASEITGCAQFLKEEVV